MRHARRPCHCLLARRIARTAPGGWTQGPRGRATPGPSRRRGQHLSCREGGPQAPREQSECWSWNHPTQRFFPALRVHDRAPAPALLRATSRRRPPVFWDVARRRGHGGAAGTWGQRPARRLHSVEMRLLTPRRRRTGPVCLSRGRGPGPRRPCARARRAGGSRAGAGTRWPRRGALGASDSSGGHWPLDQRLPEARTAGAT